MSHHRNSAAASNGGNFIDFRKRRSYTLEEKLEIIKELESGVKQAQVAESKQIAASTVQNIWSTRDRVLRDYRRVRNHSLRKIPRNPRSCSTASAATNVTEYGDIDKALMQWYTRRSKAGGITAAILKAKAQQISKQFGHYDFKATAPWFTKWTAKYGVTLPKVVTANEIQNSDLNGNGMKEIIVGNNGNNNGDQVVDDDTGLWPVTVTYGDLEMQEEVEEEVEDDDGEIMDASAFLLQSQQEQDCYENGAEFDKPIKGSQNGVEIIYRTRGSRGGRYKSYIWKYFREQEEEVDGGTLRYVECVFCNNRASPKAGRMEKHLQSCEFCPPEILETELGLGQMHGQSLQNMISSSTMDDTKDEDGDGELMDEDMIEEEDGGSQSGQSGQDQEASSSSTVPANVLKKRRTFHWKRIATYKNIEEAELALGDLSMWSRKHKHRTQQGIKTYYGCKFGRDCPVQMHLLFETRTKRVIMFQTMEDHCHVAKLRKRGLPQAAEKPIRQLYNEGVTKPSHIQQALDEDGQLEVPPRYQIAYFLDKIRREETGGSISASSSPVKTESGETITIPGYGDDLMSNWYDESNNGDDDGIEILPFFGENENDNDNEEATQNWTEFPVATSTSPANNSFKSGQGNNSNSSGEASKVTVYPATTMAGQNGSGGSSSVTVTEVVSNSINSSAAQSQAFGQSFRDETTKDGDILAPGEQNVKRRVINFIEKNFSNRDFLQIHKEMQLLKDAQKFTSLIRLASFTAGFLQTAFLDQQPDLK